jgi:hypothetical protein
MKFREILYEAAHNIEGLPDDINVQHRNLQKILQRGGLKAKVHSARTGNNGPTYDVEVHPTEKIENWKSYDSNLRNGVNDRAPRLHYYHPKHADLTTDTDYSEGFFKDWAKPKAHVAINPVSNNPDWIYRGMSFEEFQNFKKTGMIKSLGSYNIGSEQEGLTYWSDNIGQARSYADSFAPSEFKATPNRPAYIVAAVRPDPSDIKKVKGTGADEIGVKRAINRSEVRQIWRGTPVVYRPARFDLRRDGYGEDNKDYKEGSSTAPSSVLDWKPLLKANRT